MDELDEIRKKKIAELTKRMSEPNIQYPDKPVEVTDGTVDASVAQYPLFVLDCWAQWCGPCRALAPTIEELARELSGRVVFGKLNVDDNMETANKYRISAIPTMLVFKGGKLADKIIGAYPKDALRTKIKGYL